jgi:nucleotide-binding universal stress UspA family protein
MERAATLAKAFGAKLVVTSVAPVTTPASARSVGTDPADTAADHMVELSAARDYLKGQGVEADYVEAFGHVGESILSAAQDRSADMIVVGARELSLVQRLLGQSVSDSVAHGAHCDVLIVH